MILVERNLKKNNTYNFLQKNSGGYNPQHIHVGDVIHEGKSDLMEFICRGTKRETGITGDSSLCEISFEKCYKRDIEVDNGVYYAEKSGIYHLFWHLSFS